MAYQVITEVVAPASNYVDIDAFLADVLSVYGSDVSNVVSQATSAGDLISLNTVTEDRGSEYAAVITQVWVSEAVRNSYDNDPSIADEKAALESQFTVTRTPSTI